MSDFHCGKGQAGLIIVAMSLDLREKIDSARIIPLEAFGATKRAHDALRHLKEIP
jgi:hypothetical protein